MKIYCNIIYYLVSSLLVPNVFAASIVTEKDDLYFKWKVIQEKNENIIYHNKSWIVNQEKNYNRTELLKKFREKAKADESFVAKISGIDGEREFGEPYYPYDHFEKYAGHEFKIISEATLLAFNQTTSEVEPEVYFPFLKKAFYMNEAIHQLPKGLSHPFTVYRHLAYTHARHADDYLEVGSIVPVTKISSVSYENWFHLQGRKGIQDILKIDLPENFPLICNFKPYRHEWNEREVILPYSWKDTSGLVLDYGFKVHDISISSNTRLIHVTPVLLTEPIQMLPEYAEILKNEQQITKVN